MRPIVPTTNPLHCVCTVYTNTEHYIHCTLHYIMHYVALQIQ